eukprot:6226212-Alexandrium_andersonii.AAC.1
MCPPAAMGGSAVAASTTARLSSIHAPAPGVSPSTAQPSASRLTATSRQQAGARTTASTTW